MNWIDRYFLLLQIDRVKADRYFDLVFGFWYLEDMDIVRLMNFKV